MFSRLLIKSLSRRRGRKVLAVVAVWGGITLVVGLLALALDVGDKLNRELRSFGANIKLRAATASLPVRVGGYELVNAAKPAYLPETALHKLRQIFWANNLLGIVPRLWVPGRVNGKKLPLLGVRLKGTADAASKDEAQRFYGYWKIKGRWPAKPDECLIGSDAARALGIGAGETIRVSAAGQARKFRISGVLSTGGAEDGAFIAALPTLQQLAKLRGKISEVDISALTTPENELVKKYRLNPKSLTPEEYERWVCTPYPGSVAADIQSAVPGSVARVVRRVAETQGAVLSRIKGLVALLGLLAAIACALSVMGVLTSAVLERRAEVALLHSIGAHRGSVLRLFLAEAALLGLIGGTLAAGTGTELGRWLVRSIFERSADAHYALLIFAPLLGLFLALAASAVPIFQTLRQNTAEVLHGS